MTTSVQPALDRDAFIAWYRRNRRRSAQIFDFLTPDAYYERPIALRHPFVFYDGHLPAFSFLTLNERALGEAPIDPTLEKLFERGIDPGSLDAAAKHSRSDWPTRETVANFGRAVDERVEAALRGATLADDAVPRLVRAQAVYTVLEHEPMHHETLMYIIHQLSPEKKHAQPQRHHDHEPPHNEMIAIPAGSATLGAERDGIDFGWDNEFGREVRSVGDFSISRYPVTNADYLAFVRDGGPVPQFWTEADGSFFLKCAFETIPLPRSWPVYATHEQATAYARWAGASLPSEEQWQRAAFGSPQGERSFPWGEEAPARRHGNFGFARFDPEPVDAHPAGNSAWGVADLIGNGWEWTSTPFGPLAGFEPMASYPQYSADFFDGRHFVMKGASPVTAPELIRRSFRNWFYADYPYMYAKFRVVK